MYFRELSINDEKKVLDAYNSIMSVEHKFNYDQCSGAYCLKKLSEISFPEFLIYLENLKDKKNIDADESTQTLYAGFDEDNNLAAFATIRWDDNYKTINYQGHIGGLVVPEYRNKGYAQEIIKFACKMLFEAGKDFVVISSKTNNIYSRKALSHGAEFFENFKLDGITYNVFRIYNKEKQKRL